MPAWATHQATADIVTRAMFFMIYFVPVYFVYYVLLQKTLKNQHPKTALLVLSTATFVAIKLFVTSAITAVIYLIHSV